MIDIFFSYSHKDEALRDELEIHLSMLKRQGLVRVWHDRRIPPGGEVHDNISNHLEEADVILLLVSPYFLASDYCYDVEMKRAMERHNKGEAILIPVILEPCDWLNSMFKSIRATPKDGKPVSKFANTHDAFLEVTQDIRKAAETLNKGEASQSTSNEVSIESRGNSSAIRSSNLRVRKEFTDHERDKFIDESFEYIVSFFEDSLDELTKRNQIIDTRFKRTSETEFTAAVYMDGDKKTSCRVWLPNGNSLGGDIAYSTGKTNPWGINEFMNIDEDGYKLGLQPMGIYNQGNKPNKLLTKQGAAEYFWNVLLSPLQ